MKSGRPDPLETLLGMPLRQRITAIARDVESRADRFSGIDPFDLADALEVPRPEQPSVAHWNSSPHADSPSLEEYVDEEYGPTRIATYTVKHGWIELNFEAEVNDAGVTVELRTPYDDRDGRFRGSGRR